MTENLTPVTETLSAAEAVSADAISMTEAAPKPLSGERLTQALEAVLFAAGHPLSFEKLAAALYTPEEDIRRAAQEMQAGYEARGIQLILLEDECQLATKEEFYGYVRTALGIRRGSNLSRASLETLAIVAYNQPVTRSYVDEVRGVDTGYVMSSLLEKGLIEAKGRLDAPGRPTLYGTTDAFLRVFGLNSLASLPPAELFLQKDSGDDPDTAAQALGNGEE